MIVQFYEEDGDARVFIDHMMVCGIEPGHPKADRAHVEAKLRQLRLRRATKWERTDWGYQARLRFVNVTFPSKEK